MPIYPGIAAAAFAVPPLAIPTFVAAGAGSGTATPATDLTPAAPASIATGDWLFAHVVSRGTGSGGQLTCATPADWALLHTDVTVTSSHVKQFIFAREWDGVFAMPAINWDSGTNTAPAARARIYAVRGTDGTRESSVVATATGDGTIEIPAVTTLGPNRLVLVFATTSAAPLPTAPGHAAGEIGGDYTAPVTGFSSGGGNCGIMIQTAPMVSAGVISGGVITMASGAPNWVCRAFALLPG